MQRLTVGALQSDFAERLSALHPLKGRPCDDEAVGWDEIPVVQVQIRGKPGFRREVRNRLSHLAHVSHFFTHSKPTKG